MISIFMYYIFESFVRNFGALNLNLKTNVLRFEARLIDLFQRITLKKYENFKKITSYKNISEFCRI